MYTNYIYLFSLSNIYLQSKIDNVVISDHFLLTNLKYLKFILVYICDTNKGQFRTIYLCVCEDCFVRGPAY